MREFDTTNTITNRDLPPSINNDDKPDLLPKMLEISNEELNIIQDIQKRYASNLDTYWTTFYERYPGLLQDAFHRTLQFIQSAITLSKVDFFNYCQTVGITRQDIDIVIQLITQGINCSYLKTPLGTSFSDACHEYEQKDLIKYDIDPKRATLLRRALIVFYSQQAIREQYEQLASIVQPAFQKKDDENAQLLSELGLDVNIPKLSEIKIIWIDTQLMITPSIASAHAGEGDVVTFYAGPAFFIRLIEEPEKHVHNSLHELWHNQIRTNHKEKFLPIEEHWDLPQAERDAYGEEIQNRLRYEEVVVELLSSLQIDTGVRKIFTDYKAGTLHLKWCLQQAIRRIDPEKSKDEKQLDKLWKKTILQLATTQGDVYETIRTFYNSTLGQNDLTFDQEMFLYSDNQYRDDGSNASVVDIRKNLELPWMKRARQVGLTEIQIQKINQHRLKMIPVLEEWGVISLEAIDPQDASISTLFD